MAVDDEINRIREQARRASDAEAATAGPRRAAGERILVALETLRDRGGREHLQTWRQGRVHKRRLLGGRKWVDLPAVEGWWALGPGNLAFAVLKSGAYEAGTRSTSWEVSSDTSLTLSREEFLNACELAIFKERTGGGYGGRILPLEFAFKGTGHGADVAQAVEEHVARQLLGEPWPKVY